MKLSEIYDQLAYGELRQVVLGTGALPGFEPGMPTDRAKQVFPFVVSGLTELHKRFKLREAQVAVPLVEGQADYPLDLTLDLMQIEQVTGIVDGEEYVIPLNEAVRYGIRTTAYNRLLVPTDPEEAPWLKETTQLVVTYRADHPPIDINIANAAPLVTEILLPATYVEPLLYYIASRVTSSFGATGEFHESGNYAAKFEQACAVLRSNSYDLALNESGFDKFHSRGFV